jgi:DNA-binding transcriptional LysR family regulator
LPKKLEPKHFEKMMSYPLVRWYLPDMDESEMRRSPEFRRIVDAVDVALETSHLFSAIEVVKRTNCILMGAPFITRHPQLGIGLATVPLPHDEKSMIHYVMATHKRVESSAPHQWVREKILEIISHLDDEEESGDPYQDYKLGRPKVFNRGGKKAQ